jgi:hypothetical protein
MIIFIILIFIYLLNKDKIKKYAYIKLFREDDIRNLLRYFDNNKDFFDKPKKNAIW